MLEVEESARGGIGEKLEQERRNSKEKEKSRSTVVELEVEELARGRTGAKLEQEGKVKVEEPPDSQKPPVQENMADSVQESTFLVNTQLTLISYCPLR